jgi:HSP20 family protein
MKKRSVPEGNRFVPTLGGFPKEERFPFPRFAAKMMQRALSEPVIDVFQTRDEVVATVELPGVKKEDISLKVSPGSLLLQVRQGQREERRGPGRYEYSARFEGHSETVSLPARVLSQKAKATYKNGVLEVRAPKERPGEARAGSVKID